MWVAKVKLSGEKGRIGSRTKKFNVSVSGFPVSFYTKKDGIYVYLVGFIFGEQKNKERFIKDVKKEKGVLHFENKDDFIIAQIVEPLRLKPMYDHRILNLEPIFIDERGYNNWTIGSWNKEELMNFVKVVEKEYDGELISITQQNITNFSIVSMQSELTFSVKAHDFCTDKQEAQEASHFLPVDFDDETWRLAIGLRDVKDENSPYHIHNSGLQDCCADISEARDILYYCQKHKGLMVHDRNWLKELVDGHGHPTTFTKGSPIGTILEKLLVL